MAQPEPQPVDGVTRGLVRALLVELTRQQSGRADRPPHTELIAPVESVQTEASARTSTST